MANNFTASMDAGKERTSVVFASGGTNTVGVTVVVDAVKCGSLQEALNLLDKVRDQLQQAPWPPATLA